MLSVDAVQVTVALLYTDDAAATPVGAVGRLTSMGATLRVVLEMVAVWAEALPAASIALTA